MKTNSNHWLRSSDDYINNSSVGDQQSFYVYKPTTSEHWTRSSDYHQHQSPS